jgi:hypothetical protein
MGTSRGTRSRSVAACLFIVLAFASLNARAGIGVPAPSVHINSPEDTHVFGPGELIEVTGTAEAIGGVYGIRAQYWLLNKVVRDVVARCEGCGTATASWSDRPDALLPGYYVVKAYAVDQNGQKSDPQQRSFATGLEILPKPETPKAPEPPTNPGLPIPGINPPKPGTLPGAEQPIPVSGISRPGTDVTVFDKNLGPIATTVTKGDGKWGMGIRFPTGSYSLVAQAVDSRGRVSPVSKLVTFKIDATRPVVELPDNGGTLEVFPPTDPVRIEGHVFDNKRVAYVVVEYWLLNDLAVRELAECPACGTQEAVFYSVPEGLLPGYYYVKIRAFDAPGNPSWVTTTTFIAA